MERVAVNQSCVLTARMLVNVRLAHTDVEMPSAYYYMSTCALVTTTGFVSASAGESGD